jgi:ABC-2 type transport system ATP-binding protein
LIAGLIHPTEGSICVGGYPPRSIQARRLLGYVPETPVFLARYSARAVLRYHAALGGLSRRDIGVEVERLLQQVKLEEYARRRVGGFSQGMRQRLALAVALINSPRLLLLDEPSNGLDPIGVIELRRILTELRQAGATVVVSSHRLGELEKLTSDYIFLDRGRIVRFGDDAVSQQGRCLRVQFLPGTAEVTEVLVAPYRLLEASPTQIRLAVGSIEDVPEVVACLVKAGVRVTSAGLETEDVEQAFVRLCQERAS